MATTVEIDPVTDDINVYINEGVAGSATLEGIETFTNKTLVSPKLQTAILDTSGNELLKVTPTASAINEITLTNAAIGGTPTIAASGDDTNINLNLVSKGTGTVQVNGVAVATQNNATHTGDATGATALTVVRINGTQLSSLATGLLKNTTGTGVPSIAAAGTDYVAPSGALGTPSSGTLTNCTGLPVAGGGTGRATGTTAYALIATGTTATGAQQSLTAGATTDILVGGGAAALPVWTAATGSGSPVRATSPALVTPVLGTPSSGNLTSCTVDGTNAVGYRNIPQNSKSANYTLVLGDAGYHILHPSADVTERTITIPANASVAFPIGTAITFVNQNNTVNLIIAITTDTMRMAGSGITGSRTLAPNGMATALKLTATEWIINGMGMT